MFGFFFAKGPINCFEDAAAHADTARFAKFHRGMLEHGIYLAPSQYEAGFTGGPHFCSLLLTYTVPWLSACCLVMAILIGQCWPQKKYVTTLLLFLHSTSVRQTRVCRVRLEWRSEEECLLFEDTIGLRIELCKSHMWKISIVRLRLLQRKVLFAT